MHTKPSGGHPDKRTANSKHRGFRSKCNSDTQEKKETTHSSPEGTPAGIFWQSSRARSRERFPGDSQKNPKKWLALRENAKYKKLRFSSFFNIHNKYYSLSAGGFGGGGAPPENFLVLPMANEEGVVEIQGCKCNCEAWLSLSP